MTPCGLAQVYTDVSEKHTLSIFRAKDVGIPHCVITQKYNYVIFIALRTSYYVQWKTVVTGL
jgi:hypothetical protein